MPLGFADVIFLRERSDGQKYVCASQATIKEDSLVWLFKDADKTSVTVRPGTIVQKKATVRSIGEEDQMER